MPAEPMSSTEAPAPKFSREQMRKLEGALAELRECRRLADVASAEEA